MIELTISCFSVVSYAVPPHEILSKDSVTVSVDAVVYFRTSDPIAAVNNVDDAIYSTKLLAQTTLRNALGMKTLTEMLTEREAIAQLTETILDEGTEHWGIKVNIMVHGFLQLLFIICEHLGGTC